MRCAAFLPLAAGIAAANLLINPGFSVWQGESLPASWLVENPAQTSVTREPETAHAAVPACRLTRRVAGSGDNKGVSQHVRVAAGQVYRYAASCLDNTAGVSLGLFLTWRSEDSTFINSEPVTYSRDNPTWQAVADTAVAPTGAARCEFVIRTYGETGAPAGLRVIGDDAELTEVAPLVDTVSLWFTSDSLGARLCEFIAGAASSIDYCCYNSSRSDVTLALIAAHQDSAAVRVITDNARLGEPWIDFLRAAGIAVWTDSVGPNSSAYMHNKFLVRDAADADSLNDMTWVASYNANRDEVFADYAMEIPGRSVAAAYLGEFNQMWGSAGRQPRPESARFHTGKTDRLATHDVLVNGNPARVYFSPQTPVVDTIAALARRVEREAAFAVFAFTRDDLADELIAARDRGAAVGGLLDRASAGDTASVYRQLRNAHIPVRVDSSLTVHEKLLVADSSFAVTGSANWSNNANNANDENTLIITDRTLVERLHAEVVRRYVAAGGTWPPGVEETEDDESRRAALEATICRGVLCLPPSALTSRASLFDPTGRAVARLHPGPNDIRHLTPGVYLVLSIGGEPSAVEVGRVVVTR